MNTFCVSQRQRENNKSEAKKREASGVENGLNAESVLAAVRTSHKDQLHLANTLSNVHPPAMQYCGNYYRRHTLCRGVQIVQRTYLRDQTTPQAVVTSYAMRLSPFPPATEKTQSSIPHRMAQQ